MALCSCTDFAMDDENLEALRRSMKLRMQAERLLGEKAWFLVESYGKLMDGPDSGRYVSALKGEGKLDIAKRLVAGQLVTVHLMHRHRSGNHEVSSLRLRDGQLLMVFKDREELA